MSTKYEQAQVLKQMLLQLASEFEQDASESVAKTSEPNDAEVESNTFALAAKSHPKETGADREKAAQRDAIALTGEAEGAKLFLRHGAILIVDSPVPNAKSLVVDGGTFDLEFMKQEGAYRVIGMPRGMIIRLVREGGGTIPARFE